MRVVVITGAAGSLGAALAAVFANEPDTHTVLADLSGAQLQDSVATSQVDPSRTTLVACDVSDRASVQTLIERGLELTGRIDVMINNAGVLSPNGRIHNLDVDAWQRCLNVNVMGVVNGIWAVVPSMRRAGGGSIINTASVAGSGAFSHASPYSASKAAVMALTRGAAVEYARDGITVNCVSPGVFRSNIHTGLPDEALHTMGERHPMGLGSPGDVVGAFQYLASPTARWTTGASITVDGGYLAL